MIEASVFVLYMYNYFAIIMKLSPNVSSKIHHFILEQGIRKIVLFISGFSILVSILVTVIVMSLFSKGPNLSGITIAVTVPTLIAPFFSYVAFSLYFELEQARKSYFVQANTDELTQLFNRRRFIELAENELSRAKRYGQFFSVILFDVDDFKKVNDQYGHLCGDIVLREISSACRKILRKCDILARFGGEEFILLLTETDSSSAQLVARKLCQLVAGYTVVCNDANIQITISVGVTTCDPKVDTLDDLLSRADRAMYRAKGLNKNRIAVE